LHGEVLEEVVALAHVGMAEEITIAVVSSSGY